MSPTHSNFALPERAIGFSPLFRRKDFCAKAHTSAVFKKGGYVVQAALHCRLFTLPSFFKRDLF